MNDSHFAIYFLFHPDTLLEKLQFDEVRKGIDFFI